MFRLLGLFLFSFTLVDPEGVLDQVERAREERRAPEALSLLLQLEQASPDDFARNNLAYLKAVLLQEAGKWAEAHAVLKQLAAQDDHPLADRVLVRLLDGSGGNDLDLGRDAYEKFLSRYPGHRDWARIAFRYAQRLRDAGQAAEAKRWFDRVWRKNGDLSRRASLEHARFHIDEGNRSEAIRDLDRIILRKDSDDVALAAVKMLDQLDSIEKLSESETRRRAEIFLSNRETGPGREYLASLRRRFASSPLADKDAYLWGRSFVLDENLADAIKAYEEAYRLFPKSGWGVYSKYLTATTALRARDYSAAVAGFKYFVEKHPLSKQAPDAYFNLADTFQWLGKPREAEDVLAQALSRWKSGGESLRFRYSLARLKLVDQSYEEALAQLLRLDHLSSEKLPSGVTREEVHFWKGFVLRRLGRHAEAETAFQEAAAGPPNYFSFLARSSLTGTEEGSSTDWILELLRPRPWRNGSAPDVVSGEDRVRELLFLRLYDEASQEIERLGSGLFAGDRARYYYNLAFYSERGGRAEASIRAAERLREAGFSRLRPNNWPEELKSLLYPRHYWPDVKAAGERHGVDPLLLLAVIRQESRFDRAAKSPAAARGLMQLMQPTATTLAQELGIPKPDADDLYRPEVSVELGAYLLGKLISKLGGVEKALAAYNSGEGNARRWAEKVEGQPEPVYVANIGFRETKLYVLRVLGNYYSYRSLYESEFPAGVGSIHE